MKTLAVVGGLAIALSGAAGTGLQAQTVPGEAESAFCWRGKAPPACRSFALFELEGGLAVASTTVVHESSVVTTEYPVFENELKWHLGAMRNLSNEWALGGTLSLGTGSPSPLTGIRVRARRWLEAPMSAELEAGAVDTGINDRFGSGFGWGPTFGVRLNMGDHVSVFTRWEARMLKPDRTPTTSTGKPASIRACTSVPAPAAPSPWRERSPGAIALWVLYALSQGDF